MILFVSERAGLCCCAGLAPSDGERGLLSSYGVCRRLTAGVFPVAGHGLRVHGLQESWRVNSVVVAPGSRVHAQ